MWGSDYTNLRRLPSALVKQISLGSQPFYFETLSMGNNQLLNSSKSIPAQVFKFVMYLSIKCYYYTLYSFCYSILDLY